MLEGTSLVLFCIYLVCRPVVYEYLEYLFESACLSTQAPVAMNSGSSLPAVQTCIYFYLSYTDLLAVAMNIAGYGK